MHDAPEVVQNHSDLIPAQVQSSRSPEVVHPEQYQSQYGYSNLDSESTAPSYSPANGFNPSHEKKDAAADVAGLPIVDQTTTSKRRKRRIWVIVGVVLLVLAIGLGVGLGVGLSSNGGNDDKSVNNAGISESSNS